MSGQGSGRAAGSVAGFTGGGARRGPRRVAGFTGTVARYGPRRGAAAAFLALLGLPGLLAMPAPPRAAALAAPATVAAPAAPAPPAKPAAPAATAATSAPAAPAATSAPAAPAAATPATPATPATSAAPAAAAPPATPATSAAPAGSAVLQVGMTVEDLDRSEEFFAGVLGFEKLGVREVMGEPYERLEGIFGARLRVARLRLGGEEIELTEYLTPRGRPIPADSRSNDRWFQHLAIVVADMDAAYRRLREHRVRAVSTAPQRLPDWNPNAGGIRAFYFQDPDGHNLEVIWYPPGKGDPRWQQRPPGRLFLGIDHTAIVVADAAASLAFYRGLLGMRVTGESDNYGPEQERLNLVFGARLRITTLRAPGGGPGVELLQYLAPPGGRPAPAGTAANDLVHWQTTLAMRAAGGLPELAARLQAAGAQLVSPGPVDLGGAGLGFRRALLARDPDGHALRLVEP